MEIITKQLHDASNGLVKPAIDPNGGGIHVISSSADHDDAGAEAGTPLVAIKRGDMILSCPALAIALDVPHRHERCAYCAMKLHSNAPPLSPTTSTSTLTPTTSSSSSVAHCDKCAIISICQRCKMQGVHDWHERSGECAALKSLVLAHSEVFSLSTSTSTTTATTNEKTTNDNDGNSNSFASTGQITMEMADEVDSSYILTIRILIRRWNDDDCILKLSSLSSPFPPVEWSLLDELYKAEMGEVGSNERQYYDAAITKLCQRMMDQDQNQTKTITVGTSVVKKKQDQHGNVMYDNIGVGVGSNDRSGSGSGSHGWITKASFDNVMRKVVGCGHAVTDVTASLGCQCVGRALFLEHSFYNHSCVPNAFLSCHIQNDTITEKNEKDSDSNEKGEHHHRHQCALTARVHCIKDVDEGGPVTISYIPTSGLDRKERRQRLCLNYNFTCQCEACDEKTDLSRKLNKCMCLPDDCDVDILRQMQFSCHEKINEIQKVLLSLEKVDEMSGNDDGGGGSSSSSSRKEDVMDELQFCISTIKMNQRGMKFQNIPPSHEVSIEAHRLLAASLSLAGAYDSAVEEHALFLKNVQAIQDIFDPVALATSLLEYARDLQKYDSDGRKYDEHSSILSEAYENAVVALGEDHCFVQKWFNLIVDKEKRTRMRDMHDTDLASKRQKIEK